jgi:hypothetical protein
MSRGSAAIILEMRWRSEGDKPSARLVQEQHLRARVERERELQLPPLAVGHELHRPVGALGEPHGGEPLERLAAHLAERLDRAVHHPLAPVGADDGEREVLRERQLGEHVGDLEGAPHAERGAPVLGIVRDVAAEEPHAAARGLERARDAVEQRRLARAVGADEHAPLARGDRERHAVHGRQAAEDLGELADLDRRLSHRTSPSGARALARRAPPVPAAPRGPWR